MSVDIRQMIDPPSFYDLYIAPDTTSPTVDFTAPEAGAFVSAYLTIAATASDLSGIDRVEFYYNAGPGYMLIGSDASAPYSVIFNTTAVPDGAMSRKVIA